MFFFDACVRSGTWGLHVAASVPIPFNGVEERNAEGGNIKNIKVI